MKNNWVFWVLLFATKGTLLFAQDGQDLLKVDSLLCTQVKKSLSVKALKDSIAVYQLYIRLDLDSANHQLKEVKFSDPNFGKQLFPNIHANLKRNFDFGQIHTQSSFPIHTILVPVFIAVENYKGHRGNQEVYTNANTVQFAHSIHQLLSDLKDDYYVSFYGAVMKITK